MGMQTTPGVRAPGDTGPMRELSMRPLIKNGYSNDMDKTLSETPLLRSELGDVLRGIRQRQGRTLREVSSEAQVSLGYLSEVERGQKEASSELLEAITSALRVPLWFVLREEFYEAVEATFGSALGRSYVSDLYLASLGATARDALAAGANPDEVWARLCEETGREDARWIHRIDPRERGR